MGEVKFWHMQLHPDKGNWPDWSEKWKKKYKVKSEEEIIKKFLEQGVIGLGWGTDNKKFNEEYGEIPLSEWEDKAWEEFEKLYKKDIAGPHPRELRQFVKEMKPGDVVLIHHGANIIGLVEVKSDYFYSGEHDIAWYPHRRKIEVISWYDDMKDKIEPVPIPRGTLQPLNNPESDTYKFIKKWLNLAKKNN